MSKNKEESGVVGVRGMAGRAFRPVDRYSEEFELSVGVLNNSPFPKEGISTRGGEVVRGIVVPYFSFILVPLWLSREYFQPEIVLVLIGLK